MLRDWIKGRTRSQEVASSFLWATQTNEGQLAESILPEQAINLCLALLSSGAVSVAQQCLRLGRNLCCSRSWPDLKEVCGQRSESYRRKGESKQRQRAKVEGAGEMLSASHASRKDFHATAKVLAGTQERRGRDFRPDVPFFCTATLVGSWKGPRLALPTGNCSSPQQLWSLTLPSLPWQTVGQDQAISVCASWDRFLFIVVGRKTSHSAASILLPSQADCLGLAPGTVMRGKMHFREYFCVCSSLQSPWGEAATKAGA